MTESEALLKTIEIYSETKEPVSQGFYQSLCIKAAERIKELEAVCHRESGVLLEALKRKNNKSMIKVVAESLKEQALK